MAIYLHVIVCKFPACIYIYIIIIYLFAYIIQKLMKKRFKSKALTYSHLGETGAKGLPSTMGIFNSKSI